MNLKNAGELLKIKTGIYPWLLEVHTLPKITSKKHEAKVTFIRAFNNEQEAIDYLRKNKKEIISNDRQTAHIRGLGEGL